MTRRDMCHIIGKRAAKLSKAQASTKNRVVG